MATFSSSLKPTLIYIFAISDEEHQGSLKIGETTLSEDYGGFPAPCSPSLNAAAHKRIDAYTKTAGIAYQLLYTEMAVFFSGGTIMSFNDSQVHRVLERSGIKKKIFDQVKGADEWYCCDLETAKKAILAVKQGRTSLNSSEISAGQTPIIFRPEQRKAIDMTITQFRKGNQMLWNAKMRFGKTLSALQVVKEEGYARTLILTHRPVVDKEWFDGFGEIFHDSPTCHYGSRTRGENFASLRHLAQKGGKFVYFASMQDLRGSDEVGGKFDKDSEIYATPWEMLIIDEAHEGTKTDLGASVIAKLVKPHTKVLRLSGTPFNLLDDFKENEVFTWDYIMEQRAKAQWDSIHHGDHNPYAELPAINIYTYDLGRLLGDYADDEEAFNFREFFRTNDSGKFIHGKDIDSFLTLLCKSDGESLYPYSCDRFRRIFRHTLWMLPGVAAARALSARLRAHPVFGNFKIVNVAGNGDEDEENDDALEMVKNAMTDDPDSTWTITLSCGRLTTGVSVKPWTAVFMMAGSFSTSAAGYMQTIFRVQTPFTYQGKMKTECYAFDFAPDRTLRVLAETAHVSARAGKQSEGDREILGEFLNFCPIISIDGSQMHPYDVNSMMGQLKRAQIERVVRGGFEDGALYNDSLLRLSGAELSDFKELKGIIGSTKAMAKTGDIDINSQGFTNEEYEEKEKLSKKPRGERTPEEQARLGELKEKQKLRRDAISILRGISIRMPLLIYGAELKNEDDEITIDNFADVVDDESWREFMPEKVTKDVFAKFRRYYDPDVFREAGRRIREMARAADKLSVEERIARIAAIFQTFHNPDKETVLTPWRVVNMHMGDSLGGYCFYNGDYSQELETPRLISRESITGDVFTPESKILDINSKTGLYPLYCAYNTYRSRVEAAKKQYGEISHSLALSLWDATLRQNIFVVCKTPMAQSITRRTLAGFRSAKVNARYYPGIITNLKSNPAAVAGTLRDGKHFWHISNDENMKFSAVVGNPPYQLEGDNTRKTPIYNYFYDIAFSLSDKVSLITPGRFLFKAGQAPKEWMDKMLSDPHLKVVDFFQKSTDVFPSVDIKGGVVITYRDADKDFGAIGFFSEFEELKSIYTKVRAAGEPPFSGLVSSQGIYQFSDKAFRDFPQISEVQGRGTAAKITSRSMERLPALFLDKESEGSCIRMIGLIGGMRAWRWIEERYVKPTEYLRSYNVFVPEANGSGAIGEVLSTPMIGSSDTFLSIGKFASREEASACLKYVKTKFARAMLGTLKATQHNPKDTWGNVPLQDFTSAGDIDWTQGIAGIDRQLYRKYGLSDAETSFIERVIKPME